MNARLETLRQRVKLAREKGLAVKGQLGEVDGDDDLTASLQNMAECLGDDDPVVQAVVDVLVPPTNDEFRHGDGASSTAGTLEAATYHGTPPHAVTVETTDGTTPLPHITKHSPAGFSWGFVGSGPAELARCLLIHALGEQAKCQACKGTQAIVWDDGLLPVPRLFDPAKDPADVQERCIDCEDGWRMDLPHQVFKFHVVARWDGDSEWTITRAEVLAWLAGHGFSVDLAEVVEHLPEDTPAGPTTEDRPAATGQEPEGPLSFRVSSVAIHAAARMLRQKQAPGAPPLDELGVTEQAAYREDARALLWAAAWAEREHSQVRSAGQQVTR